MNRRTFLAGGAAWVGAGVVSALGWRQGRRRPTASQLIWQRDELAMFLHFGVNTFTNREWGDGSEAPAVFAPAALDAREWARVARMAGFRSAILTAKHHDGFCLWPTRTTKHSVASSPWRSGQGDLVAEFVKACRAEGLRPGLYLSPWDRNSLLYGDSPRYNDLYVDQLGELLTNYGDIHEVWFDGANGEGPNGRKQEYDWPRVWNEVRRLQPRALIFSDAGPDLRWCGNETGTAGDPNWSTVDPASVPAPGLTGEHIIKALQHGQPDGAVWRPAECNTSIRPGWFHHPAEDGRVLSADRLMDLYFRSVGHNGKLLLNVPPTREGVLHATDVARLRHFAERRREVFGQDLADARRLRWSRSGATTASGVLDIGRPRSFGIVRLEEAIANGQTVARYSIHGAGPDRVFRPLARGTTIGYARLDRVRAVDVRYVRVDVEEAVVEPEPLKIRLYP